MNSPHILVVYYSLTGASRALATALRAELHCDIEGISERVRRTGPLGHLRSIFEDLFSLPAEIRPVRSHLDDYDLVIVGGPVWNGGIAAPVRTFVEQHRGALRRVAFFCTYSGSGSARALRELEECAGQPPVVTLDIRRGDVSSDAVTFKLRTFAVTASALSPPLRTSPASSVLATA